MVSVSLSGHNTFMLYKTIIKYHKISVEYIIAAFPFGVWQGLRACNAGAWRGFLKRTGIHQLQQTRRLSHTFKRALCGFARIISPLVLGSLGVVVPGAIQAGSLMVFPSPRLGDPLRGRLQRAGRGLTCSPPRWTGCGAQSQLWFVSALPVSYDLELNLSTFRDSN